MTWNNRIFKHTDYHEKFGSSEYYQLHETYYDESNKIISWTVDNIAPHGDTVDELIEHLEQMLNDAKRSKDDILDYDLLEPQVDKGG